MVIVMNVVVTVISMVVAKVLMCSLLLVVAETGMWGGLTEWLTWWMVVDGYGGEGGHHHCQCG